MSCLIIIVFINEPLSHFHEACEHVVLCPTALILQSSNYAKLGLSSSYNIIETEIILIQLLKTYVIRIFSKLN